MIFTYHLAREPDWRCAYRNLKAGDQEETKAHRGVWWGNNKPKQLCAKAMVWV